MSNTPIYTYTYQPRGHDQRYTTRVQIIERGEHEGNVIYLMNPIDGKWPHRDQPENGPPLYRAIVMTPKEEHEWLNVDLVREGGNLDS